MSWARVLARVLAVLAATMGARRPCGGEHSPIQATWARLSHPISVYHRAATMAVAVLMAAVAAAGAADLAAPLARPVPGRCPSLSPATGPQRSVQVPRNLRIAQLASGLLDVLFSADPPPPPPPPGSPPAFRPGNPPPLLTPQLAVSLSLVPVRSSFVLLGVLSGRRLCVFRPCAAPRRFLHSVHLDARR